MNGSTRVGSLVGYTEDGYTSITNCYSTATVTGYDYVGGLVGYNSRGNITNSYATGTVTGTRDDVGGLVGINFYSTLTDCHATGSVTGGRHEVGGLVGGALNDTIIIRSYATGNVRGDGNRIGGLTGRNTGSISESYATGNVTGSRAVYGNGEAIGGLVGENACASITNSYATGNVLDARLWAGGLVGSSYGLSGYPPATITNSYATGNVNVENVGGGLAGQKSTCTITNSFSTGIAAGSPRTWVYGGLIGQCDGIGLPNTWWYNTTNTSDSEDGPYADLSGAGTEKAASEDAFKSPAHLVYTVAPVWNFTTVWEPPSSGGLPHLKCTAGKTWNSTTGVCA